MPQHATETAVFKVLIHGTIQAVWREITKTDELQGCMFNNRLETDGLRPGGQVRMRTKNGKYTGVVGEITEWDPPRRYAHTFRFTNFSDAPCTCIYDLEEVAGGVNFTLTCENVPVGTKTAKQMTGGGKMIVNTLKTIVETGRPSLGIRLLYTMFRMMEPMSPKSTRSERWP